MIHGVVLFPRDFDFGGAIESATLTSTRVQPNRPSSDLRLDSRSEAVTEGSRPGQRRNSLSYTIEGSGPYHEDEVRRRIRAYCDEHGFHAALTLTVIEIRADGTPERQVDPGTFLD